MVERVRDYAVFTVDPAGRVMTWNDGAMLCNQYTPDEIIGCHISILYPPEEIAAGMPERELEDAARKGSIESEGWRIRKDGTRYWASVVVTALHDEADRLIGYSRVTRDLTAKRDAELQLRESEARFRLLVHNVKDYAIFMLDPDGRVVTWNEGAERIKGYTAEEIIGRHFSVFYPQEAVDRKFPQYELKVAAEQGSFEHEGWRVRKDGSLFWASVVITALRNDAGVLMGFAKITRDLTERREAQERALADARRMAEIESANRAKSEFLTMISHELRTPLNAIGGYADLLAMQVPGNINDRQKQFLERIKTSQQHLLAIVNDLLQISRIESGRLEYDLRAVSLAELFVDLEAMVLPQTRDKNIAFEMHPCETGPAVYTDAARTQQILLNLLSNAIKFTPAGGRIGLDCRTSDDRVEISVSDTGPGIPPDKLEAIFEPFVQLGRSLTSMREGVGLGLAISRDLARGMNGELSATSRVGEGSVFTLVLPLAR